MRKKLAIVGRVIAWIVGILFVLFLWFPRPRFFHVNKTGTVVDSITSKPISDAIVAFGVYRACGGVGGTSSSEFETYKAKTDSGGRYSLRVSHFSLDWISFALMLTGCGSTAEEYVCKEGYIPVVGGYDYRTRTPISPIISEIALERGRQPFKWRGDFHLYRPDFLNDCKVEIDYGTGTKTKARHPAN